MYKYNTFQHLPVDVFVLWFGQRWIFVEQVGHKGEIEFWIPADDVGRGDELPTAEPVGLNKHGLRPVLVVPLLNNRVPLEAPRGCERRPNARGTRREAYVEARHVDVDAWLIFLCAFRRDLV